MKEAVAAGNRSVRAPAAEGGAVVTDTKMAASRAASYRRIFARTTSVSYQRFVVRWIARHDCISPRALVDRTFVLNGQGTDHGNAQEGTVDITHSTPTIMTK